MTRATATRAMPLDGASITIRQAGQRVPIRLPRVGRNQRFQPMSLKLLRRACRLLPLPAKRKRPRPRPALEGVVTIRLPSAALTKARTRAAADDRSVSAFLRRLLLQALEAEPK